MKKILAFTLFFTYNLAAQTNSIVSQKITVPSELLNFYPLKIGNKWVYNETVAFNPNITNYTKIIEVLNDSLSTNGKFYFHLRESTAQYPEQFEQDFLERLDSLDGKVYGYSEDSNQAENEVLIMDLNLEAGDTITTFFPVSTNYYFGAPTDLFSEDSLMKWGVIKPRKTYHLGTRYGGNHLKYSLTQDIGLDYLLSYTIGVSGWTERILKGCIINGIIYGDTSLVSVKNENPVLAGFELEQNYPNPFNPSTKIKYSIPKTSLVSLKVYDVLGREAATIVNEEKPAGTYEVEFNGSELSSGIYFYKIQSENNNEVKKMILIK